MSISSDNIFDNFEKKSRGGSMHKIAAFTCAAFLLITFAVLIWVGMGEKEAVSVLPQFEEAFGNGDYKEALSMYRSIHDTVVAADPDSIKDLSEQINTMSEMEAIVNKRLESIESKVRYERYSLSTEDKRFMDDMGELTSSQISNWLHELCEEFLLGSIEKPDIIFIFDQMSAIGNISATATPLLREIETIEMARGDAQDAEAYFNEGEYIEAVKCYQSVTANYEGFVYDFSSQRIDEIKEIMYEPMLNEGEHMLETYKYYSAEELLSDLAVIFPDDVRINSDLIEATSHTSEVHTYRGTVEVICIRNLIANDEAAFGGGSSGSSNDMRFTLHEFSEMLRVLYEHDYVLVDAESLVDQTNENFLLETPLTVPVGKKPLIIIIENLDYSAIYSGSGTCSRLLLNDRGQVCAEYIAKNGESSVSRGNEAIGILDQFVEEHPDFSYNGAKGIISICGYESCMGYVVDKDEEDDRNAAFSSIGMPSVTYTDADIENNRATVKEIMDVLSDTGWKFASSTYGNINARDAEMDVIVSDTQKWMTQIESLTGDVHMIVYPGGNYIFGTDERAEYLKNLGFRIFFGIGSQPYYIYGNNYLYYDRAVINPSSLKNMDYSRLFGNDFRLDDVRSAS